ncbi:hypothetical protein OSB04_028041 [Centaurea solstitialis]|uniref:Uncharacterized protein n=1 Tax=Centaurea solstitialis TaxID=347529 RepID=A0AA38W7C9_9ASTR|nr:hypothetical protein OSB04_028041 [Centaurea solstitialis]
MVIPPYESLHFTASSWALLYILLSLGVTSHMMFILTISLCLLLLDAKSDCIRDHKLVLKVKTKAKSKIRILISEESADIDGVQRSLYPDASSGCHTNLSSLLSLSSVFRSRACWSCHQLILRLR